MVGRTPRGGPVTTALATAKPDAFSALVLPAPAGDRMQHPVTLYLAGLRPSGMRAMRDALARIARIINAKLAGLDAMTAIYSVDWTKIRYTSARLIRLTLTNTTKLAAGRPSAKRAGRRARAPGMISPATIRQALSALKGVMHQCRYIEDAGGKTLINSDDFDGIKEACKGVKVDSPKAGRMMEQQEIVDLLASCDLATPIGARDAAILAIGLGCGLRRFEIAGLDTADYKAPPSPGHAGSITVQRGKGKGGKPREVPFPSDMKAGMDAWLRVRGTAAGPLVCPMTRVGKVIYRHISPAGIYLAVQRHWQSVELKEKVSPHDFRRTLISRLLDKGVDLVTVQGIAGHANPKTTAGYDRRGDRVAKEAIEKLGYGWGGGK